jgi:hypothetical protein
MANGEGGSAQDKDHNARRKENRQRTIGNTHTALPEDAVQTWHELQWHTKLFIGSPVTVTVTFPHAQRPTADGEDVSAILYLSEEGDAFCEERERKKGKEIFFKNVQIQSVTAIQIHFKIEGIFVPRRETDAKEREKEGWGATKHNKKTQTNKESLPSSWRGRQIPQLRRGSIPEVGGK